ncbi:MAG: hypothetical protein HG422_02465 [Prevotella sp.]|nr:hypothetical protein [Prevotella sp.]
MTIKMDVHSIANAGGGGAELRYVKLLPAPVRSRAQLKEAISHRCTLTGSDVEAVLSALRDAALEDLSQRGRFYLPEIGYLTVSASVKLPRGVTVEKVKGNYVGVRNIRFCPERRLLVEVRRKARFERLKGTTVSCRYTAAEMETELKACLAQRHFISRRVMQQWFSLTAYSARKWLRHFVDAGLIEQTGLRNAPVYVLK